MISDCMVQLPHKLGIVGAGCDVEETLISNLHPELLIYGSSLTATGLPVRSSVALHTAAVPPMPRGASRL